MSESSDDTVDRRNFLKAAGSAVKVAAGAAVGLGAAATGVAMARHVESLAGDDTIQITFDRDLLERYQPKLRISAEAKEKYLGQYAWAVSSQEYEYDVLCYWDAYSYQEGNVSWTSHFGDHEPIFLYVDDSGVVQDRFSAYHWYAGGGYQIPTDDGHPVYEVVEPWHHHVRLADPANISDAEQMELKKLGTREELLADDVTTEFESWLANGLEKDLAVGAGGTNPAIMLSRPYWWATDYGPVSKNALKGTAWYFANLDGAEKVNPRNILTI